MNRPTLSLAMIMKNEAHNLPRLFASIKDCFDEIHITDTGSTDGSVELAKSLGAIVHHFDWVGDFAAARNYSFSHVKTDFVMWLDLDDVLHNRDAFIAWRDTAMEFADYWMATYHYSLDAAGKPNCSFMRERVMKVDKGFRWRYFVHEGITPDTGTGPIRPDYIATWAVNHMRSADDLKQDKSRNISMFESRLGSLDARMKYYYGKELFENGNSIDAFKWLVDAIADPALDQHDRILGIQYACYAATACNQHERAIALAYQGIQIAPNRAEFYVIVGDSLCKMNKLMEAIPPYSAAKSCTDPTPAGSSVSGAIFSQSEAYGLYPRNQIARIYGQMGNFERGKVEARECLALYNNHETAAILADLEKYASVYSIQGAAKPCEDIVITCPPVGAYEWDAELAKTKGMGGSETAAIEMSKHLHKLSGRPVKIFAPREKAITCDGVEYLPVSGAAEWLAKNKPFAHIAWRHNMKVTDAPTYLWAHDLITMGAENTANYEKMLCLTPFHKRYAIARQGVPENKIHLTRNGIKPERFFDHEQMDNGTPGVPHRNFAKKWNKIVFPSSPDRGLDRAMRVLDKVRETYPEIELHVFYGFDNMRKFGQAARADMLEAMVKERPWVKYHGFTQQDELIKHFKEASIWLHPCDFIETSCITAMEMLCCGVYPVTRKLGGLMDTLKDAEANGMATLLPHDCVTELEYQAYIRATLEAIAEKKWERVNVDPYENSWETVAASWLNTILRDPKKAESVA